MYKLKKLQRRKGDRYEALLFIVSRNPRVNLISVFFNLLPTIFQIKFKVNTIYFSLNKTLLLLFIKSLDELMHLSVCSQYPVSQYSQFSYYLFDKSEPIRIWCM